MSDKISIVIPCYWANKELGDITDACLRSLYMNSWDDLQEVLVIDDGSPLNQQEVNCAFGRVIVRGENGGYAAAVNTGLKEATGGILIISNNDIEFIQPDWLDHLLKPLHEGYDIASIRSTEPDGWETEDYIEDDAKFGCIWAMKRAVYETLGGLDESYGKGYFEDLDYHERARRAGFKIGKNHAGLVEHKGKATFKMVDPDDRAFYEAQKRFKDKWGFIR